MGGAEVPQAPRVVRGHPPPHWGREKMFVFLLKIPYLAPFDMFLS